MLLEGLYEGTVHFPYCPVFEAVDEAEYGCRLRVNAERLLYRGDYLVRYLVLLLGYLNRPKAKLRPA